MKHRSYGHVISVFVLSLLFGPCYSGRDTQGTEFILGFLENTPLETPIELLLSTTSSERVTANVSIPLFNPSWRRTVTLTKGDVRTILVPKEIRGANVEKSNKGVLIQASQELTVYAVNKELKSTDSYLSIPVDTLGTEYFALTYAKDPAVIIVGTANETQVSITFPLNAGPCEVAFGGTTYRNGDTLSLSLNRFETFHVAQINDKADLTGAHIVSNKPIGVISGNVKVPVPVGAGSADHLCEMLTPVETWGKRFLTTSTPDRTIGDVFRIVASESNTNVTLSNGTSYVISGAGDFLELKLATGNYQMITADKALQVAMFSKSFQNDGPNYGDPSMSLVIPEAQYASDYTWSSITDPTGAQFTNAITVVISKDKVTGLRLDGHTINWNAQKAILGSDGKVDLWTRVSPGSHHIYHVDPTVTFLVMVSGTYKVNSYAYAAGMRLAMINAECIRSITTPGDIIDNDCDGRIDEELLNGLDDDGDGEIDEDLSSAPPEGNTTYWGDWSQWMECENVTCKAGLQFRERVCEYSDKAFCPGNPTETRNCSKVDCAEAASYTDSNTAMVAGVSVAMVALVAALSTCCCFVIPACRRRMQRDGEVTTMMVRKLDESGASSDGGEVNEGYGSVVNSRQ